jgi:hypothetical protein
VILRLGELIHLPPGVPDVDRDVVLLRYTLLALAVVWSVLRGRGHSTLALLAGLAFVLLAHGFWAMTLGRPYGLLLDPQITQCAGEVSVAAAGAAPPGEGLLVNEPATCRLWAAVARRLHRETVLLVLPTLLTLVVQPLIGVLVYALWPRREQAFVASFLWLAFSTGDLETLRGVGFVPGLWMHPGSALLFVLLVAMVLALGRLRLRGFTTAALGASVLSLWLLVRGPFVERSAADTLLLLSLDQTPWWLLAAWAWRRGTEPSARALILGGAGLVLAGAFPLGVDAWGAQAFYRLGLLLAAAGPVTQMAGWLGTTLSRSLPFRLPSADLGASLLVLAGAPICFLAWWTPIGLDPLMEASREPVSDRLATAMEWVRRHTPPGSVFLASPDYAPSLAVLAGRRVLRAPTLGPAADEVRRERMEDKVLAGRDPGRLGDLYGLTHVFIAPGDFLERGIRSPEDLDRRRHLRLLYADVVDFRVYEITRPPPANGGGSAGSAPEGPNPSR